MKKEHTSPGRRPRKHLLGRDRLAERGHRPVTAVADLLGSGDRESTGTGLRRRLDALDDAVRTAIGLVVKRKSVDVREHGVAVELLDLHMYFILFDERFITLL